MALLISVFNCDDCGTLAGPKTDADWEWFEQNWVDSLHHQFCPVCKEKRENRALLEMDVRLIERIAAESKDEWHEYIN